MTNILLRKANVHDIEGLSELFKDFIGTAYQGQGVGKKLMQSIEDFGQKNNCNYVILVSEAKREGSHQFYESIGYSSDQRGFKKRLSKQN